MSIKVSDPPKRPRRPRIPIEPIHVEELLAGAGMSGFLGILETPVPTPHLQELIRAVHTLPIVQPSAADEKVASVVLKMEALMDLIEIAKKKAVVVKRY